MGGKSAELGEGEVGGDAAYWVGRDEAGHAVGDLDGVAGAGPGDLHAVDVELGGRPLPGQVVRLPSAVRRRRHRLVLLAAVCFAAGAWVVGGEKHEGVVYGRSTGEVVLMACAAWAGPRVRAATGLLLLPV